MHGQVNISNGISQITYVLNYHVLKGIVFPKQVIMYNIMLSHYVYIIDIVKL